MKRLVPSCQARAIRTDARLQAITTPSIVLEPLTVAHAPAMFDVLADAEIYRYLDYAPPPSVEHLREVYQRLEARRSPDGAELWLNWAICLPQHPPLGYVQATVLASGRSAFIAYVLASRHWGRGYAQAATQAMLGHLTTSYGVQRFLATVEADNERSIRLLGQLAFRPASPHEAADARLAPTERLYVR